MRRWQVGVTIVVLISALAFCLHWLDKGDARQNAIRKVATVQLSDVDNDTVAGFKGRMEELGYKEGKNIIYLSSKITEGKTELVQAINSILAQKPDLILVSSTNATLEVKRLIQNRPVAVIFAPVNNPLNSGVVSDLKHPGGHITGVRLPTGDDLRLQWLKKIIPTAKKVCFPYYADDKSGALTLKEILPVADHLGIKLLVRPIVDPKDLDAVLQSNEDLDAIFLPRDSRIEARIDDFVTLAKKKKIAVCAPSLQQVKRGALMSYGFVHCEIGRQAALMADHIFRGAPPGNLPVEMAESSLAINLISAKEAGIVISPDVLQQAEYILNGQPLKREAH